MQTLPPAPLPPRLSYHDRTLPNGLRVLSMADSKSPTVAVQVRYGVGAKDDPNGRAGFAHLFEHLMFKRTKNLPDEGMDRLTEDIGGENNAYTTPDNTVYHEVVPSHYLESILWAEAERMAHLQVDDAAFASERNVVKEEYRRSVLAPPYGRFDDLIERRSWSVHPYRRTVIGDIPQLDAATLREVKAFHSAYYRPDNATLVVVGDFDPARLDAWVDRTFGKVARPSAPVPRAASVEPPRPGGRRYEEKGPNVPLPALAWTYLTPGIRDDDAPGLQMLESVLAAGQASRLFRDLVYAGLATEAYAWADLRTDGGVFVFRVVAAEGKRLEQLEEALDTQIARLKTEVASSAELARARDRRITDALHQRETAAGVAEALGTAATVLGDPERVNTDLERFQAVDAAALQALARRYFSPQNRVAIRYTASTEKVALPPAKEAVPSPPGKAIGDEKPPPPSSPRPVSLPAFVDRKMANGLRAIVAPRPGTGLVALQLTLPFGAAYDPPRLGGLAGFVAGMLTRGTATRSATELAEAAEALGGELSADAGWDSTEIGIAVPRTRLAEALALIAEVAAQPRLAADEVAKLRDERRGELMVALREPSVLAGAVVARLLYGVAAYGHRQGGTPASLARITQLRVAAFHRAAFRPERAVLTVAGDVAPDEALARIDAALGGWKASGATPLPRPRLTVPPVTRQVVLIDQSDAGQAAVVVARPGLARTDPAYARALVANEVLGGNYSSRLNQEIRIRRGLAYGAFSQLAFREAPGPLSMGAQTKHESAARVAGLLVAALERLPLDPIPAAELTARQASLIGPYARGLETGSGLVQSLSSLARFGLPLSEIASLPQRVQAVTESDIQRLAASRLAARYASVVVVGDRARILPALKERFGRVRLIPVSKLDLDSPTLRKG